MIRTSFRCWLTAALLCACNQTLDVGASIDCHQWPEISWVDQGAADSFFPQGFMVSEVGTDSAIVWLRTGGPGHVQVHYQVGPRSRDAISQTVETTEESNFTGSVRLDQLRPGTCYRYQLTADGVDGSSRSGQFVTAPASDTPRTIAFSADISPNPAFETMIDELARSDADLFLSLGDFPYVDPINDPLPETEDDFRQKYIESRSRPALQELLRRLSLRAIWDDHEVEDDWSGSTLRERPDAVAAGMAVWREWFPIDGGPRREIYRRYHWGTNIEVFELDARSHRDPNDKPDGPQKTMLGATQLTWLLDGLRSSTSAFKLVVTSVPLAFGTTGIDNWNSFAHERAVILSAIVDRKISGVVFLTADQHWFSVHHLNEGPKELQVGPLAQVLRTPPLNEPPEVVIDEPVQNFGVLRYQPTPTPRLVFEGVTEGGRVIYTETILSGLGSIRVACEPERNWTLRGAHTFTGRGSTELPWATPGTYTIHWEDSATDLAHLDESLDLEDGKEIAFSVYEPETAQP